MVSSMAVTFSTNHLLRPPPPSISTSSPSLSFLLRPLCISFTATPILSKLKSQKPLYPHKSNNTHLKSRSSFSLSNRKNVIFCRSLLSFQASPIDDETHLDEETEEEEDELDEKEKVIEVKSEILKLKRIEKLPDLNLTVKEKKELCSYANSLGKKLKSQLVGKSGVTENVATSFVETLESNELLKIKIHRSCPGELDDAVNLLEKLTGSVVVGKIGRTVILYRPSITKLKAEEKKEHNRKLLLSRRSRPFVPRGQERKPYKSGTGRHESSFSIEKGQEWKPFKRGTGRRGSSFSLQKGQERTPFRSGRRGLSKV